ncbi:MAG: transketolase [Propionibacteriaceae bacterium]|jgi:transketolase|nr:transketolase [Propionibacteriaceae bacterium]
MSQDLPEAWAETGDQLRWRAARSRRHILRMLRAGGAGHLGGAMSCVDLVTCLYFHTMRHDPARPQAPGRDRFILSAGHKCLGQYSVLAEAGYFDLGLLDTYGHLGTPLPGHPDMTKLPGVEANTGSLGHGLSIGLGMALGLRADGLMSPVGQVYVLLGDGELPEGSNWEAAAAAHHHRVGNLTALVDVNGLQISGRTAEVMSTAPLAERWAGFGWDAITIDGHDIEQILSALEQAHQNQERPCVILAHTVKAKGVSFAEDKVDFHYWKTKPDLLAQAEAETEARISALEEVLA